MFFAPEVPTPDQIIGVKRMGGYRLEAHLDGDLVFPVVIDYAGASLYPAWDPFVSRLTMWDTKVPAPISRGLSRAWATAMSHPSFAQVA